MRGRLQGFVQGEGIGLTELSPATLPKMPTPFFDKVLMVNFVPWNIKFAMH